MIPTDFIPSLPNREVVVVEHNPDWSNQFSIERARIERNVTLSASAIEHVGSTSVPHLPAKPTIDIAIGCFKPSMNLKLEILALTSLGYRLIPELISFLPNRRVFWRGSSKIHTHHVHLMKVGCKDWEELLAFRNHLKSTKEDFDFYAAEKIRLATAHRENLSKYVSEKSHIYREILGRAIP